MQAYCMKCRTKREMKDAKSITMKNGKPATQGVCPTCGTKMFRIGKQANDNLISQIVSLLYQIVNLLHCQAWKYLSARFRSIYTFNGIELEVAFPSSPIAESSDCSIVSMFGIATFEICQEFIDAL